MPPRQVERLVRCYGEKVIAVGTFGGIVSTFSQEHDHDGDHERGF